MFNVQPASLFDEPIPASTTVPVTRFYGTAGARNKGKAREIPEEDGVVNIPPMESPEEDEPTTDNVDPDVERYVYCGVEMHRIRR